MHLPWKKGWISRLVADLHRSPKHGGSLVVETGFPTSLIDLLVKNRDRLKKKKSNHQIQTTSPLPKSLVPAANPPRPRDSEVVVAVGVDRQCSGAGYGNWRALLIKVCLLSALGVGSRKVALGMMIAAFLLLFVEYIGTRFCWIQKGLVILKRLMMVVVVQEEEEERIIRFRDEEIQAVEATANFDSQKQGVSLEFEGQKQEQEQGERIEILIRNEHDAAQRRKSNLRANFFKKFVKKERKRSGNNEKECKNVGEGELRNQGRTNGEESCISSRGHRSKEEENDIWVRKNWMILVIIVLGGLVGGRTVALVLTVSWCFLLRFVFNRIGSKSHLLCC